MIFFKIVLFCNLIAFEIQAATVDRVIAVVNNDIVTESDVRAFEKKLQRSSNFVDELLLMGKSIDTLKKNRTELIDFLINERLVDSEIRRMNLSVSIDRVNQEIASTAKRNGVQKNELIESVKKYGVSVSEYQDFIKSRIERQSLVETEVTSKIRISEEDIISHYLKLNPNSDSTVFEFNLSHIFFNSKKGGETLAKERANVVLSKIKAGENFEVLAEQNSEDPNFTSGGLLGVFKAGEFVPEFERAVIKLEVGGYSNPVVTKNGVHILKVNGKKVVSDPKFDKEKDKIRSTLFEQTFQKNFKLWLANKRDDSFIKINKL